MRIGIDGRVVIGHAGSGLANYTLNILRNVPQFDDNNQYYICFPNKGVKLRIAASEGMPSFQMERKDGFWDELYQPCKLKAKDLNLFHNTCNGIGVPDDLASRVVLTLHDLIPFVLPETVELSHKKYVFANTQQMIERAEKIVTVSNHSKYDIYRYFNVPQEQIDVVYPAVSEIYHPIDNDMVKAFLKNKYGINFPFMLYLGGFSWRKNIKGLIEAYNLLPDRIKRYFPLVIIGHKTRSYEEIKVMVERYNLTKSVIFLGFIPTIDLPYFYNGAALFIYPSLYEGFGLPPIEAMACGTPTLVSNVSSLPEVVGDAALKVDPADYQEMSNAIQWVAEDAYLAENLRLRGLNQADKYSINRFAEGLVRVYGSIQC